MIWSTNLNLNESIDMDDPVKVLAFPQTPVSQWQAYERQLTEWYSANGIGASEIASMMQRMKPIYLRHARNAEQNPQFNDAADDPFTRVQAYVFQLSCGLFIEIIQREAALIKAGLA